MMFAWVYNKTLDDGKDYWVVGTGYDKDIYMRLDGFFEHVKELYQMRKRENRQKGRLQQQHGLCR